MGVPAVPRIFRLFVDGARSRGRGRPRAQARRLRCPHNRWPVAASRPRSATPHRVWADSLSRQGGDSGSGRKAWTGEPTRPAGKLGDVCRDILEWIASLARWQNDPLRRRLRVKELSEAEVSELAEATVAKAEQQPSSFPLLSADALPSVSAAGEHRVLAALPDARNINAPPRGALGQLARPNVQL
jgi:hypothetical protein